jgi:hypothetical protein
MNLQCRSTGIEKEGSETDRNDLQSKLTGEKTARETEKERGDNKLVEGGRKGDAG